MEDNDKNESEKRRCTVCKTQFDGPTFGFPTKGDLRQRWKQLCNVDVVTKHSRVCIRHFENADIKRGKLQSQVEISFGAREFEVPRFSVQCVTEPNLNLFVYFKVAHESGLLATLFPALTYPGLKVGPVLRKDF